MHHCPGCNRERDDTDFYADKSRGTGLSRLCKECHKEQGRRVAKEWYAKNKAKHIQKVLNNRKK